MTVEELVEELSAYPQKAKVYWLEQDEEDKPLVRIPIHFVVASNSGDAVYLEE